MSIKKRVLPIVLGAAVLLTCCLGIIFLARAADGSENTETVMPTDLWTIPAGITAEANVAVPDYMLYGKEFISSGSDFYNEYTESSEDLGLEDWQQNGIKFSPTAANRWVEYKNVVDISTYTSDDVLLAFTPLTSTRGNAEIYEFDIKITDADDENNYLLIKAKPSQWFPATFTVETATIDPCGYKWGGAYPNYLEETFGFSDNYQVGFDGLTRENTKFTTSDIRHRSIILHYDYLDKSLWVTGQYGNKYCIMDLDWSESMGYGNEWQGFTSGRVKISFASKQHRASEPSYMILNVFNTPMCGTTVDDTEAPVIMFGDEVDGENAPAAVVGNNYTLPGYYCLDVISGSLICSVSVTDPDGNSVDASSGSFTPAKAGYYTAVYRGVDGAGNPAQTTLKILANKAVPTIAITAEPDRTDVLVGEKVYIPEAVYTLTEGAVIVSEEVKVIRAGYAAEEVSIEDGTFTPLFAGEYRVIYTAVDYLGFKHSETLVYTVQYSENGIVEKGSVQELRRLFDGVQTVLPEYKAYDYESIPGVGVRKDVTVEITGNGTTETYADGDVFTPDLEKFGNTVSITYKAGEAVLKTYTAEIWEKPDRYADDYVDDGSYQLDDYFILDEGLEIKHTSADKGVFKIDSKEGATGEQGFAFVNPLRAEGFTITFAVDRGSKNFSALRFTLRDSFDSTIGFDLWIESIPTATAEEYKVKYSFISSNDGVKYSLEGVFGTMYGDQLRSGNITITYRDGVIYDVNNNAVFTIKENIDGTAWKGFPSGKVYLDCSFEGIGSKEANEEYGSGASIKILSLCSQAFNVTFDSDGNLKNFVDTSAPQIVMSGNFPSNIFIGQRISVPMVSGYDTLSPYVSLTVMVQAPNGTVIYNYEPLQEGMSFVVEQYGNYYVRYTAKDASGNTFTSSYSVSAADTTAPTLVLSDSSDLTGKIGKAVSIPSAIVQDDRDTAPRLFIMVIQPDTSAMNLGEVTAENAIDRFTPTMAGKHTVVYYAIDADYNATVKTVTVVVE